MARTQLFAADALWPPPSHERVGMLLADSGDVAKAPGVSILIASDLGNSGETESFLLTKSISCRMLFCRHLSIPAPASFRQTSAGGRISVTAPTAAAETKIVELSEQRVEIEQLLVLVECVA